MCRKQIISWKGANILYSACAHSSSLKKISLTQFVSYYCALQVVASLQAQLEQRKKEAEQRDLLFHNLSQETENMKKQLVAVSTRCKSLETQAAVGGARNSTTERFG